MSVWDDVVEEQLIGIIRMTGPDKDVHAGKNFLLMLLKVGKKDEFVGFIEKARKALSEEGSLDLEYDFTPAQRELFKRAALNHISRRELLGVHGWLWPGAIAAATGGLDYIGRIQSILDPQREKPLPAPVDERARIKQMVKEAMAELKAEEEAKTPSAAKLSEGIKHNFGPAVEVIIGVALMNEAHETAEELKIEQISDAISQVVEGVSKLAEAIKAKQAAGALPAPPR